MLRIDQVVTRAQVKAFLDLPERLYPRESRWVAPLRLHVRLMMGKLDRPDQRYWLASWNGTAVARMGARAHPGDAVHFGFFECHPDHPQAVRPLLEAARSLRPELPLRGPCHFHLDEPYPGVLVEGFEEDPSLLMPYNPPYYDSYLRAAGAAPRMDLFSYQYLRSTYRMDLLESRARRAKDRGVSVRKMGFWHRIRDIKRIIELANQTHRENWGYQQVEGKLVQEFLLLGLLLLDPNLVFLAFQSNRPVGFVIVARDLNPILKGGRGRLSLSMLASFLSRDRNQDVYRGYALGVLAEARSEDVAAALIQAVVERAAEYRGRALEVSWILANNGRMNALARAMGGRRHKAHRVYEYALSELEPASLKSVEPGDQSTS